MPALGVYVASVQRVQLPVASAVPVPETDPEKPRSHLHASAEVLPAELSLLAGQTEQGSMEVEPLYVEAGHLEHDQLAPAVLYCGEVYPAVHVQSESKVDPFSLEANDGQLLQSEERVAACLSLKEFAGHGAHASALLNSALYVPGTQGLMPAE